MLGGSLILFITSGFGLLIFFKSRNPGSGFSKKFRIKWSPIWGFRKMLKNWWAYSKNWQLRVGYLVRSLIFWELQCEAKILVFTSWFLAEAKILSSNHTQMQILLTPGRTEPPNKNPTCFGIMWPCTHQYTIHWENPVWLGCGSSELQGSTLLTYHANPHTFIPHYLSNYLCKWVNIIKAD